MPEVVNSLIDLLNLAISDLADSMFDVLFFFSVICSFTNPHSIACTETASDTFCAQ